MKGKMGCIHLPQLVCWRFLPNIIWWVRNLSCLSRSVIRPRISHQILKEFSGSHFYLFTWLLESWQIEICGIFREQLCKITLASGQTVCGTPGNFGSYIHTHTQSLQSLLHFYLFHKCLNKYLWDASQWECCNHGKQRFFFNGYLKKKKKVVVLILGRNPFFKRSSSAIYRFMLEDNFYN